MSSVTWSLSDIVELLGAKNWEIVMQEKSDSNKKARLSVPGELF